MQPIHLWGIKSRWRESNPQLTILQTAPLPFGFTDKCIRTLCPSKCPYKDQRRDLNPYRKIHSLPCYQLHHLGHKYSGSTGSRTQTPLRERFYRPPRLTTSPILPKIPLPGIEPGTFRVRTECSTN